jgi:MFS transporter, SHS family, sialic acid transporter
MANLKPGESFQSEAAHSPTSRRAMGLTLAAAILGWMFDGFEMGLFPLVARPALQELMGASAATHIGTWISWVLAGFLVGAAIGGVAFGWLGDRIGRVRAMVCSIAIYAFFSGLCVFVTAPWQLAALRFIASLGMGGEWALGVALVMETWPGGSRTMLAALIGAAAQIGFLMIALMGLALSQVIQDLGGALTAMGMPAAWVSRLLANSGWRLMMLIGAAPVVLTFLIQIFVPESKRWRAAAAAHPKNRVMDIFAQGLTGKVLIGMILSSVILLGTWGSVQWIPSWADKLTGGQMPQARSWTQIVCSLGMAVGSIVGAYAAKWTSRRWAYFLLCTLSLLACGYLFRSRIGYGNPFFVWVFIVGALTASGFGWLPLYLPELFPTRIRATAQGFAYNGGRIFAAAGTLWAGQLLNYFQEDYARMCSVTSLVFAVGMICIWFSPETKGRPLPE